MGFRILGPLAVTVGGRPLDIGSARQRTILALLLVRPGRIIATDDLVETVWNEKPPATARTQIAICIAALRKKFSAAGSDAEFIVTKHPGYQFLSECHYLDSVEFERLTYRAQAAIEERQIAAGARLYEQALALWRGTALAGVAGVMVENEAARLEELRLAAHDGYVAAKTELGHYQELLPGLVTVVRDQPLREQSRYALMLAQYRVGRRAEALETFRDGRKIFIREMGLDPGSRLQALHDAILRDDVSQAFDLCARGRAYQR